jgi:YVTN family beta-propeller protein
LVVLTAGTLIFGAGKAAADVAYVANEVTGTISVIDTKTRTITATIGLGSDPAIPGTPQPDGPFNAETQHHNPFYNGHVGTHGLWLTPDGAVLVVANRISGTIVAIDTATNVALGYAPVGREPHLATVRPGGKEAWVAVRGESHIEVLKLDRDDLFKPGRRRTDRMKTIATIDTVRGPSMVTFTSDGRFAFVAAGKQNRVDKIDAETRKLVASQTVPAAFTPFGLVTPDDQELYLVHKGAQKLSILRASDLSVVVEGMPIGPCANHVWFVGKLAYITIGGAPPCAPAGVDREGKIVILDRTTRKIVHELTGPAFTGDPHGIWGTSDGRLYVGHERGNRVTVINTGKADDPFDDAVEGTVTGSPQDLGFMKQPIDIVIKP